MSATLVPAGLERSVGIKTARYAKDASDPQWFDDPELKPFYEWMKEYVPTANPSDTFYLSGGHTVKCWCRCCASAAMT